MFRKNKDLSFLRGKTSGGQSLGKIEIIPWDTIEVEQKRRKRQDVRERHAVEEKFGEGKRRYSLAWHLSCFA